MPIIENRKVIHSQLEQSKIKINSPILTYAVKTRQGFIPGQQKTNQDSFIIHKDFSGIKNLWMMGVCDGHGLQGHLVSNFVKINLPKILNEIINMQSSKP